VRLLSSPRFAMAALASFFAFGGCSSLERSLIFPGTATQGRADTRVASSPDDYELLSLTTRNGMSIVAQFGRALTADGRARNDSATQPTVLYFYGNGACVAFSQHEFDAFRRLGFNVIIPDFPGYGMSNGIASEHACYEAADAVYDHLLTRDDIDRTQLIAAGWSMGAAVAIDLASRRPVVRLITISAFTSMPAVAKSVAPWAPTSLIIRSRFNNTEKIASVACPILLIHGTVDELVPFAMAAELASRVTTKPVRRLDLPAGHNDIFFVGGATLWKEIADFLGR
jgi:pimeloyl-ACP methyl ester carboxylesterase